MRWVAEVLMVAGAAWCVLAAIGVLKFSDVYSRQHAGTKATTLGLLLVVAGAVPRMGAGGAVRLVLVALLVLLTVPVGAHLVGRAVHRNPGSARIRIDSVDELD